MRGPFQTIRYKELYLSVPFNDVLILNLERRLRNKVYSWNLRGKVPPLLKKHPISRKIVNRSRG